MEKKYRDIIYGNYIQNGFRNGNLKKMYKLQYKYFTRNYLKHLPINKDARILDLGCGIGEFIYFLRKKGYENIIGVDGSKENIECCRRLQETAKFINDDIFSYLKRDNEKFDCIVFNDVIEHLTKEEVVDILLEIKDNIKKGGTLIIKTPNMANPFVNTAGRYIDFTHETGFTEWSMRQVLFATGFSDVVVKGTDVYVLNFLLSIVSKAVSKVINVFLYILSCLYGRKSIKVFEKDIIAIAKVK